MNRAIRGVSLLVGLMFLALMANATIGYLVRTESLLNDDRNVRVRDEQFGGPRGTILAANTPIAENVETGTLPYAYQRSYLNGPLYAPVTGYYSYIYGRSGLEQHYNAELTGHADSQFLRRMIDTLTGTQTQGGQLQTTIQPRIQQAAWDALGGRDGAVVAIDYSTGAVLGWVSSPSYDPAALSGLDFPAVESAWNGYANDPSQPMLDRATQEVYPPGSTFKMVVAAAALENGYSADQMIDTPEELPLPGTTISLPNEAACGNTQQSLSNAFTLSCNTTFANIALDLGEDTVASQANKFGFGTELGADFSSAASYFPTGMDQAQLAMSSIGQFDVAATPLQMAMVAGAFANDGVVMSPYVVQEVRDTNQMILANHHPTSLGEAVSPTTAATMQQMMTNVVTSGTGTAAQVPGLTIAGKTGTAETASGVEPYSWFAGYCAENKVALGVFLADPQGGVAAQTAGQIFGAIA